MSRGKQKGVMQKCLDDFRAGRLDYNFKYDGFQNWDLSMGGTFFGSLKQLQENLRLALSGLHQFLLCSRSLHFNAQCLKTVARPFGGPHWAPTWLIKALTQLSAYSKLFGRLSRLRRAQYTARVCGRKRDKTVKKKMSLIHEKRLYCV